MFLIARQKACSFFKNFLNINERLMSENIFTKQKPNIIKDYAKYMGDVDVYDKIVKTYFAGRKTIKYTNKFSTYRVSHVILTMSQPILTMSQPISTLLLN
ncbi:hypothetical protein CDIK_3515 [Cucumispora dikerogammari]|nr:hypothetical protein CDIK_3515 [Cucumispora dikerogammari]